MLYFAYIVAILYYTNTNYVIENCLTAYGDINHLLKLLCITIKERLLGNKKFYCHQNYYHNDEVVIQVNICMLINVILFQHWYFTSWRYNNSLWIIMLLVPSFIFSVLSSGITDKLPHLSLKRSTIFIIIMLNFVRISQFLHYWLSMFLHFLCDIMFVE